MILRALSRLKFKALAGYALATHTLRVPAKPLARRRSNKAKEISILLNIIYFQKNSCKLSKMIGTCQLDRNRG